MKKIPIHVGIKALIFDCDGTLVDTMPLHMNAWEYSLQKYGLEFYHHFFYSRRGMSEEDIMIDYNNLFNKSVDPKDVITAKHEYFSLHISSVKPIKNVVDIVYEYENKLPMGVVSGGTRKNVLESLRVIGIEKFFKVIITADDNLKPKPAPNKFFAAAKVMNVEPKYCQVFEDGNLGIEAARKAGMIATDVLVYID